MKKLFGGINLTWKKVVIFAIIAGIYTGIMALLPITRNTSFADISISFEVWILFGIIIIMNSKSNLDSALKCFIFFLISQPLVYLVQVPFNDLGWSLFRYYKPWFIWTLFTFPMGYIGYFIKKDKWWGLLILTPIIVFLGSHYSGFLSESVSFFPYHLISALFCLITMIIYPLYMFKNKIIKYVGLSISLLLIIVFSLTVLFSNKATYNTTILVNGGSLGAVFDDSYKVYLMDESFGKLYIVYEENLDDYMVNAEFRKIGKTEFTLESPSGEKTTYIIDVKRSSYHVDKK